MQCNGDKCKANRQDQKSSWFGGWVEFLSSSFMIISKISQWCIIMIEYDYDDEMNTIDYDDTLR